MHVSPAITVGYRRRSVQSRCLGCIVLDADSRGDEIAAAAAAVKDANFRIQVSRDGLHVYNRDGLHTATDPFDLFPRLQLEHDGAHG